MAYARPVDSQQIVVPLDSAARAGSARAASEHRRAFIPEVDGGACIEFTDSRRTGNIEVTLRPPSRAGNSAEKPGVLLPGETATCGGLNAGWESHAGMPSATGDFGEDLRTFDAEASALPHTGAMEGLMAQGSADPAARPAPSGTGASAFCGGVDVRLARIMDAWPRLSPRTRAAITAALNHDDETEHPTCAAGRAGDRSPTVRAARSDEAGPKNSGAAGRRRSRKSAGPGR
jgi:hypothetical protein